MSSFICYLIASDINMHNMSRFCFNSINLLSHLLFLRNCQRFYIYIYIRLFKTTRHYAYVQGFAIPNPSPIISKIIQRLHSFNFNFLTLLFAIFEKQCPPLEATRSSNIQQRLAFKRKAQIRPCSNLAFLSALFHSCSL